MQKFGFVFPGQGSQKLGMLADLASNNTSISGTFDEASAAIGLDLWETCQDDPDNILDQTHITQPVLLTASVAIARLWREQGGSAPAILAGHSLGEYSALVCAGVLSLDDGVRVVHQRGKSMQAAVDEGTGKMAAIVGLENYQINEICDVAEAVGAVSAANFNSPGQTVIAGETAAVDRAITLCKEAGAKRALPLNVSVPSHCALMSPAAKELETVLEDIEFSSPNTPVVQNVSADIYADPEQIKQNLIRQLYEPVQWVDCVRVMHKAGVSKLIECGPGKVLCGLIKRIESDIVCFGSEDEASLNSAIAEVSV
ncbi:MAG: [acyl-carrier-protein] S-malonyltransferase [Gammaproteobacteria bacterium]|nr:[acyl-carrier-protein] S-malonyltransferase [Gammaproteobacteria bacterium]